MNNVKPNSRQCIAYCQLAGKNKHEITTNIKKMGRNLPLIFGYVCNNQDLLLSSHIPHG